MGKYTSAKVLTEKIDNSVGFIQGLVFSGKQLQTAYRDVQTYYSLEVIEMAMVKLKYELLPEDNRISAIAIKPAIAQYTLDEIKLQQQQQADEFFANQAKMQPQIDAVNEAHTANVTADREAKRIEGLAKAKAKAQAAIDAKKKAN